MPVRTASVIIDFKTVKTGKYAIAVFLDENDNSILDKNFFGIPTEPYGFSNNVIPAMRAATFSEAVFEVKSDQKVHIRLKE